MLISSKIRIMKTSYNMLIRLGREEGMKITLYYDRLGTWRTYSLLFFREEH